MSELKAQLGLTTADAEGIARFAVHMLAHDASEAADAAHVALTADPACFLALLVLGTLDARAGNERDALAWYARAQQAKPESLRAWTDAAELHLALGELGAAAAALGRAMDLNPRGATPAGARAMALVAQTASRLGAGR